MHNYWCTFPEYRMLLVYQIETVESLRLHFTSAFLPYIQPIYACLVPGEEIFDRRNFGKWSKAGRKLSIIISWNVLSFWATWTLSWAIRVSQPGWVGIRHKLIGCKMQNTKYGRKALVKLNSRSACSSSILGFWLTLGNWRVFVELGS